MDDGAPRNDQQPASGAPAPRSGKERRRWSRQPSGQQHDIPPPPPALTPLIFSTEAFPAGDQFAAWQGLNAPLVDLTLPDGVTAQDGFAARQVAWNLGGMLVVQQKASAHSYHRSAAKLRSSLVDHWAIIFRREGKAWTEVGGRVAESQPGTVEIRSLAHAFRGRMLDSQSLTLYLPRDLFADSSAMLDANNNRILSRNLAGLLISYVDSLEARLSEFSKDDLPGVVNATRDMILACMASTEEWAAVATKHGTVAAMERARRFIRNNLQTATITPELLCRELGISRTHLYQLFEPSGGVVHYIQKQRLLAAHAALSDPSDRRLIAEIAESFGFASAADFSRAFSREFGYSPRQARSAPAPSRVMKEGTLDADGLPSFERWLRALGS
ncbi:helix-turn-helix domain-containing protein [Labrys sp. LIt4]|uniref:helix-turn-helix domain-containing protein n=1 Tax=Labrys sp. LIt4 TaxID=2821355 RepID=UPI001AE063CB|nr:helix-turn-helix domain-containing protein [Labrys sp. LIt4]MBP0579051.1 helix-turn-helix domain-containing protein [Labrys sp. LIt4]